MEITDIRVGNYLQFKDYPTLADVEVESINQIGDDIIINRGAFFNFFAPAPLDCRWLIRFEFSKKGDYWIKKIDKHTEMRICSDFSYSLHSRQCDNDSIIFENDIIKDVHRLQNIWWALSGKELGWNS